MERVIYKPETDTRYRLTERKKRKVKRGEFFLDSNGKLKKSPINSAEEFYVYEKEGEGRFTWHRTTDKVVAIYDYATSKQKRIQIFTDDDDVADEFVLLLNRANLNSNDFFPL